MNSTAATPNLPPAPRILVRGVNWLGDAVMTTPALLRLREKYPAAHIGLLCPAKLADLWKHHPAVDEVISFSADESVFAIGKKLRRRNVSLSLSLSPTGGEDRRKNSPDSDSHVAPQNPDAELSPNTVNVSPSPRLAGAEGPNGERAGVRCSSHHLQVQREDVASPCNFDLALVLPNSPRSALEVFLARIPQRIGYERPWRNFFLTQAVPSRAEGVKMWKLTRAQINQRIFIDSDLPVHFKSKPLPVSAHQIHEYLNLVAGLGANSQPLAPQLAVTEEEIESAKGKFGLDKISQPIFGLNPGAEYGPAKRWPVESFIRAAHEIQRRSNCAWILFGGKNDAAATAQIESAIIAASKQREDGRNPQSAIFNLAGKTSLRELMALLKLCRVLLTNDTGPMHVAAALGTPVVVPFGSTSPELTGPGLPSDPRHRLIKSDAPCSPCFLRECPIDFRCMRGISVEQVVEATLQATA